LVNVRLLAPLAQSLDAFRYLVFGETAFPAQRVNQVFLRDRSARNERLRR
jgi:hypothetical protein